MCFFLSREAVHRHREIVAKRRRGVDAPLSAPRDRDGDRDPGGFKYAFAQNTSHFPSQRTKTRKGLHRPGIEPGSVPWQGTILPLDHRCIGFIASSQESDTGLAIFGIINRPKFEKFHSHQCHYHTTTTSGDGGQDALTHSLAVGASTGAAAVAAADAAADAAYSKPETQQPPTF